MEKLEYFQHILLFEFNRIRRRGMVGRVPAFQPGSLGPIPGRVRNFNFCPGIGCVPFVFCPVLSSAEALTLCSFSNLYVNSPTSQLILQPFRCFTYITAHSPTLPLLHIRHSSFSNSSFASPTSQALHLHHLVSRPAWCRYPHPNDSEILGYQCTTITFSFPLSL